VNKWIYTENFKLAIMNCADELSLSEEARKTAKQASTLFKFLNYDEKSDTSVLKYIF